MPRKNIANDPPPAGRRFLYWLGTVAEQTRLDAGVRPEAIGALVDLSAAQIRRFEKAIHFPNDPDKMLAAYAMVAGLDDPRELYQKALDAWYQHGSKPLLSAKTDGQQLTGPQQFEQTLAATRRAAPPKPSRTAETPSATPKRRAKG